MSARSGVIASLLVAASVTFSLAADPEDCPPHGPPSQLTATFKDFGAVDRYLELNWQAWPAPPSYDSTHYEFVRWEVQRKPSGGEYAELIAGDPAFGVNPSESDGVALNYVRAPEDCTGTCAEPGGTYSFRVRAHYKYREICLQFDGVTYTTNFSNEATITVPGGTPVPEPATNVIAVGHTKKRQVDITWTPPAEKPRQYAIRRRVVGTLAKPSPRADEGWEVVGRAGKTATKFTDRRVEPDKVYDYIVEAIDSNVSALSAEDRAYALPGKCRKSAFTEPEGAFAAAQGGDAVYSLGIVKHDVLGGDVRRVSVLSSSLNAEDIGITVSGDLGAQQDNALARKSKVEVTEIGSAPDVPSWAQDLLVGHKGKLELAYVPLDPMNRLAFRQIDARLKIRPGLFPPVDIQFRGEQAPFIATGGRTAPTIALCAAVGVGTNGPLLTGKRSIVLYQIVNEGPVPLYSKRVVLKIATDGGRIVGGLGSDFFELTDEYSPRPGGMVYVFSVGAIGPESRTRSQVATLALQVEGALADGADRGQMLLAFDIFDGEEWIEEQIVHVGAARRSIEIPLARGSTPAKR